MSNDDSVTTWLTRLKAGRSSAAGHLWHRYVNDLVRIARRKLGNRRGCADEEDVVLLAFDAFLRGVKQGRFARLDDRDDLWQVLVMLTERRAISLRRREKALKRGAGQVRGDSAVWEDECNGLAGHGTGRIAGREVSPEFAVEMADQLRYLLKSLPDDTHRQVAIGKLEGYTNKELAERLGISLRAVERKLQIIRRKWKGEWQS